MKFRAHFAFLLICSILVIACGSSTSSSAALPTSGMVLVPGGFFIMGNDDGPAASKPAHQVYVSSFLIDAVEVTNAQFRDYVDKSGNLPVAWMDGSPPFGPDYPVTGILWREAAAYCEWYGLRLPTEAEWEKAARGEDGRTYPWGNSWDPARANAENEKAKGVDKVGSYPQGASPYGLKDMTGNAAEWVADYFDPAYYAQSPMRDPKGPEQVLDHGLRGGSWASRADQSSTFFRDSSHSALPNDRVGFRCAVDFESE
jgi:formylglycine-generating enzyme required for sulfatase activity